MPITKVIKFLFAETINYNNRQWHRNLKNINHLIWYKHYAKKLARNLYSNLKHKVRIRYLKMLYYHSK
jgi:alpha-galactosidase/6-phospho-beta-glucosidase family protein